MRKSGLFLFILSAYLLCGCQRESTEDVPSVGISHYVTFKADAAQTKTVMSYDEQTEGYTMLWEEGDQIAIFEYADGFDLPVKYVSEPLQQSDISNNGQTAQFRVELAPADGSGFKYVAVYPSVVSGGYEPYSMYVGWETETASDPAYIAWSEEWGYEGPYISPHMILNIVLPFEQMPSAGSFDPSANTMVSKVIESDSQIEEIAELQFARIGSILRISLTGLENYTGYQITDAQFCFGDSFGGSLNCDYDTCLEKYRFYKGFNQIQLFPESVTVDEDGCADLWVRCYAGEITDWFSLYITLSGGDGKGDIKGKEEPMRLGRYVDLTSLSRSIVIPEGKMTRFSVGNWGIVDVEGVYDISYDVNSEMDGFTVTWQAVENASGYEFSYYSENSPECIVKVESADLGNGTHSATVTDLESGFYNIVIIPIPAEGHALMDPNNYYPVRIPVGVEVEKYIYNAFFETSLKAETSFYDYEGLTIGYENIHQTGWGSTLVTSQHEWSLWNTDEFCNSISSLIFVADEWTATESQTYNDLNFIDHKIRPLDYVEVSASSGNGEWQIIAPEYGESYTQSGNIRYPVTYRFPSGTKYFKVSSDEEKLNAAIPQHPQAPASLMCTFYSVNLMIYE